MITLYAWTGSLLISTVPVLFLDTKGKRDRTKYNSDLLLHSLLYLYLKRFHFICHTTVNPEGRRDTLLSSTRSSRRGTKKTGKERV